MNTLFLNWQALASRRWHTVGRLDEADGRFRFAYTEGALGAMDEGFEPLLAFPDLRQPAESERLFPLFENRILPTSRPEYPEYVSWLGLQHDPHPFAILARTGGTGVSDRLEMFPKPEPGPDGTCTFHVFVRGLRHQTPAAIERANTLEEGERLLVMLDVQNPQDDAAVALRTAETFRGDMHILGYLPRYLAQEVQLWSWSRITKLRATVVRVNPPPAPSHFRVLVRVEMAWPDAGRPFESEAYRALAPAGSLAPTA